MRAYRQPRAIDLGNARERGCNPRLEVHPIPRRAINNIPILDTIHLEINRQPIGKPGQIDFEIDNLRSLVRRLVRSLARSFIRSFVRSLALSSRSSRFDSFSGRTASGSMTRRIHQNAIAFAIVADEREIYGARWIFINSSRISNPRSVLYLKFAAIPTSRTCLNVIYFYEAPLIETFIPEIFRSNANPALVLHVWEPLCILIFLARLL